MGKFEDLGKKLDKLADQLRATTQAGIEKTTTETREWKKYLDDLAEKIKKTTQESLEKFATETKEFGQIAKLRSQIKDDKRKLEDKFKQLGELAFRLNVQERLEDEEIKKITREIQEIENKIKEKEEQIKKLKAE